MEEIDNAISLAMAQFRAEYGVDAKLENGEEFATVFNDAVVIISLDNGCFDVKILAGKPYFVDHNLNLTE